MTDVVTILAFVFAGAALATTVYGLRRAAVAEDANAQLQKDADEAHRALDQAKRDLAAVIGGRLQDARLHDASEARLAGELALARKERDALAARSAPDAADLLDRVLPAGAGASGAAGGAAPVALPGPRGR
jgi:hypothetical protein